MGRRYKSLHHNLQPGENVVFHCEHRSPRNRGMNKVRPLRQYKRSDRRNWKTTVKNQEYLLEIGKKKK